MGGNGDLAFFCLQLKPDIAMALLGLLDGLPREVESKCGFV